MIWRCVGRQEYVLVKFGQFERVRCGYLSEMVHFISTLDKHRLAKGKTFDSLIGVVQQYGIARCCDNSTSVFLSVLPLRSPR